jgi:hypothetical protein
MIFGYDYIEKLAEQFNFKVKEISGVLYVTSQFDEWYIEGSTYLILYHKNKYRKSNRGIGAKYHVQKRFKANTGIREVFMLIQNHDQHVLSGRTKNSRVEELFQLIAKDKKK